MDADLIIPLVGEVVRERNVHEDDVFYAIEHALLILAKDRYGDGDLYVKIDRKTGGIELFQNLVVVEGPTQDHTQIILAKAKLVDPEAKVGDKVPDRLPFSDFPRIGAHASINLLYKKLEELRRAREYSEFSDRVSEVVSCIVKQTFNDGQMIVSVGKGIGMLHRNDLLPVELNKYKPGDHIKAYIKEVSQTTKYQIILSRTHNQFLAKLLAAQVPELTSGEIIIKKVVREPGRRAKVAVHSDNHSIDPVKVCVGQSGKRITPVMEELKGERIDIIPWSENLVSYAVQALKPASAQQVIFRENNLTLIVPDDQKKKAIGEHGNNVKLASALTGATLSVITVSESKERAKELQTFFEISLDVDSDVSELLVSKGFETIHDINSSSVAELSASTGIDEELADALKDRASAYTDVTRDFLQTAPADLDKNLMSIPGLKTPYIKIMYENGIKNMQDLATQSAEKITEILSIYKVTSNSIERFISYAKKRTGRLKTIQGNPGRPDERVRDYRRRTDDMGRDRDFRRNNGGRPDDITRDREFRKPRYEKS